MKRSEFARWMRLIKRLDEATLRNRLDSLQLIEKTYGDLDEIYESDKFMNLMEEMTYTEEDSHKNAPLKHKVLLSGDEYNKTKSLHKALDIYLEFKDNIVLNSIKSMPDLDPDMHDGSYELIRETVRSLSNTNLDMIDVVDLELLYFMAIGTWKGGINFKYQKIQKSNLPIDEKERLKKVLDEVVGKAKVHYYSNSEKATWSIGMFGTGFYSFKSSKGDAQKFIKLCIELADVLDEEKLLSTVKSRLSKGIKGMQAAAGSIILHCLKPTVFPIINTGMLESIVLLESEGVVLNKPKELTYYIDNARAIKKFRDEKCIFKNYRALDVKLWEVGQLVDSTGPEKEGPPIIDNKEKDDSITTIDDQDNIDEAPNYWWLNASPKIWSFENIQVGQSIEYTSKNENGNHRKIYKNFEDVKEGDLVIGYESYPVKAIVAVCKIVKPHDGEKIEVIKLENLINPIEYSRLTGIEELKNMEYFKTPRGSLFKLTKSEFDEIMDLIREETPSPASKVKSSYTKDDFLEEAFVDEDQYELMSSLLEHKKNLILQGAPGVGKTFIAKRLAYSLMNEKDDDRVEMIQFHQSYSYEDFIMGYRPEDQGFKLKYGVFYRFCRKAQNDPNREYYFIIDEINRGNLSKIFGELLMLIEADKRGETYAVPLTYNDSKFFVPKNVHIIGTMNTADRSLAMIDYALRRRFCFVDLPPAFDNLNFRGFIENKNPELAETIITRLNKLNIAIEGDNSLGKGFRIGHSYFCTNRDILSEDDYRNIVRFEIVPQLSEYWFDENDKVKEWETILLG